MAGGGGVSSLLLLWKILAGTFFGFKNCVGQSSPNSKKSIRRFSSILEIFFKKAAYLSLEKTEKLLSRQEIPASTIHMVCVDGNDKCVFSLLFKNSGHSDDLRDFNSCNHIFPMLVYVEKWIYQKLNEE